MSVREASKDKRRQRITQAARALIHAQGTDGFSMRSLASNAGVSVATPYNLFGSKRLVVLSVLQGEIDRFQSRVIHNDEDPLSTLFHISRLVAEQACEEPAFHRSMLQFLRQEQTLEQEPISIFAGIESNILIDTIKAAKEKQQLLESTSTMVLAMTLEQSLSTVIADWVVGSFSDDELEPRASYYFGLATLAMSTSETRPRLTENIERLQTKIESFHGRKDSLRSVPDEIDEAMPLKENVS